ncbi:MAG: cation diffusion facilitator family transporter [Sphingomonadaceae bacterium]
MATPDHNARRLALKSTLEARLLLLSIAATLLVAALGVVFGLLSGSMAIIFDGFFSLIDAGVTWLMLVVARLVARESNHRFQYGYWHLEPMVLALSSTILIVLSLYALAGAVKSLMTGGYVPELGRAIIYTAITTLVCFATWAWMRRYNERLESGLVRIDGLAWLMSAWITLALLVAFALAWVMRGTAFEPWVPYVDPLILIAITLVLLPAPVREAWTALREIFEITPPALDNHVRKVMEEFVARHGFARFESYITKTGRARFIEISLLVPDDMPPLPIQKIDDMRREISEGIGDDGPGLWLTVSFTADPSQM